MNFLLSISLTKDEMEHSLPTAASCWLIYLAKCLCVENSTMDISAENSFTFDGEKYQSPEDKQPNKQPNIIA